MPSFEVTAPDGKNYQIDAPDADAAFSAMSQHLGVTAPSAPVTAKGLAKAAGVGVGEGVIGLAGAPADLTDLASRGLDYVAGTKTHESIAPYTKALGSENIKSKVEGVTGEFYKPQNTAESWANTAGSFAPLVAAGPGGIARRVLTNVVAPTAGSEIAGELTKGTEAEPYARAAGAIVGGAGASRIGRALDTTPAKLAPSTAEIRQNTSSGYDALTSRNVQTPIPQAELDNLAGDIRTALNAKGVRPSTADKIHNAVTEIETPATKGAPDVADLVAVRQNIKSLLGSPDANKAGAAIALPKIDAAIERLSPGTMKELRSLDANWGAVRANEALDKRTARADLQAAGEHSGMNVGNRIRQNVRGYLTSNESRYLSAPNRASLESVVRGTPIQNTLRFGSNLLGGGGGLGSTVLGLGAAAGGSYSGHPEAALLPVGGLGLRMAANRLTARQAANAAAQIRNRSPYAQQNQNLQQTLAQLQKSDSPIAKAIMRAIIASQQQQLPIPQTALAAP